MRPLARLGAGALVALLTGCSPILGLIVRAAESVGSGEGTIEEGGRVTGSTRGAPDRWEPQCGAPDGGGDRAYVFVPPADGRYRIEVDAHYDSVVALFDAERRPLACNDDEGRTTHSMIEHALVGGQRYVIVVDGFRGATGDFELRVSAASAGPPDGAALALDTATGGDTTGRADTVTPPCGATPNSPDQTWIFTPPSAGVYAIRVESAYDAVLAVYAPGADTPLACNDDAGGTSASEVATALAAGVPYRIVVDGYRGASGAYRVVVRPGEVGVVGAQVLALDAAVQGDTTGRRDTRTFGCGTRPGSPDQTWLFRPSTSGTYVFRVDSTYDGALAVYEHGTTSPIDCNDDAGSTRASELALPLSAGQVYEVVVDGYGGASGTYTLVVRAPSAAVATPGALAVGQPVRGNTTGRPDTRTPACGSRPGTPDDTWIFTAPAAGLYRFVLESDYDGVLALYASGAELACNDDDGSTRRSRVEASLAAGQVVHVLVDGFGGRTGAYRLRVDPAGAGMTVVAGPPEDAAALEARCAQAPALASGPTIGAFDPALAHARTSCGGGLGGEAIYRVSVPQDRVITVRAQGPNGAVLELRDGCSRGHTVVMCTVGSPATALTARLTAGRAYTLVVDSPGGTADFTLETRIAPLPTP